MNSSNTPTVTASRRKCTWGWPPCHKWRQNNVNRLCSGHNARYIGGERPRERPIEDPPTAVAAPNAAAAVDDIASYYSSAAANDSMVFYYFISDG